MSTEQEPTKEVSDFSLMWNIRRNTRYIEEQNEKIKNLEILKKEYEEELKANENLLISKYNDGKPHYLKFENNLVIAIFPNRRPRLITLE